MLLTNEGKQRTVLYEQADLFNILKVVCVLLGGGEAWNKQNRSCWGEWNCKKRPAGHDCIYSTITSECLKGIDLQPQWGRFCLCAYAPHCIDNRHYKY